VPFRFEVSGSQIIYFDPREEYYTEAMVRACRDGDLVSDGSNGAVASEMAKSSPREL